MNKKLLLLPLMLLITLVIVCVSCELDPLEECESFDAECGAPDDATACCDDDQCYYTFNGTKYQCNGTDCTDAAVKLISAMCDTDGSASVQEIKILLNAKTLKLLEQARSSIE